MYQIERRLRGILTAHTEKDLNWIFRPAEKFEGYRQGTLGDYSRSMILNGIAANPGKYVKDFAQAFFSKDSKADRAVRLALGLEDGKERSFAQVFREYGIHSNPERIGKAEGYLGRQAFHEFVDNLVGGVAEYENIYGEVKTDYDGLFPTKILNAFRRSGVRSLREISGFTEEKLYSLRQIGENSLREVNRVLQEHGYNPLKKSEEDAGTRWVSDDPVRKLPLSGVERKVLSSLGVKSISRFLAMLELHESHPDIYRVHYPVSDEMTVRLEAIKTELAKDGVQLTMILH